MSISTSDTSTHLPPTLPVSGQVTPRLASVVASAEANAPKVDRRRSGGEAPGRTGERRQFGSSHSGLSESGRELAVAIDAYKLQHHRRYITCDEMLVVLKQLGYRQELAS